MDEIDDRLDAQIEQPTEVLSAKSQSQRSGVGLDAMPRHAVAGGLHAELGDQTEILRPAIVVPGELVFIERAPGAGAKAR